MEAIKILDVSDEMLDEVIGGYASAGHGYQSGSGCQGTGGSIGGGGVGRCSGGM